MNNNMRSSGYGSLEEVTRAMRKTELLIEAIEESAEEWYENFDSIDEAKKIITGALKEEPDESEIAILLSALDVDISEFNLIKSYKECLRKLKKDLDNYNESD